tara:strand:+ start:3370 stop:4161 length:792 start_codon:yes stop_codon:yes gene_type:complete
MKNTRSLLFVIAIVSMTSFQSVLGQEVDMPDTAITSPGEQSTDLTPIATPSESNNTDDTASRELKQALLRQLNGSDEELAALARNVALPLISSFKHDLNISRVDQRRRRMESARVSVMQMADKAKEDRHKLLTQMHEELTTIRKQFEDDDPQICEMEQVAVVKAFRGRLQALKDREEQCRQKAAETSKELVTLRRDKVTRERARWLAKNTPEQAPASKSPVPRLEWVRSNQGSEDDKQPRSVLSDSESLEEVLTTIEELDNRD